MTEITEGTLKIMVSSSEKVGLPGYSSVDVGPISVTRIITEGDDDHIKEELRKNLFMVEELISEVREVILDSVQAAKKDK